MPHHPYGPPVIRFSRMNPPPDPARLFLVFVLSSLNMVLSLVTMDSATFVISLDFSDSYSKSVQDGTLRSRISRSSSLGQLETKPSDSSRLYSYTTRAASTLNKDLTPISTYITMFALSLAAATAAASLAQAATYSVSDTFIGSSFLTGFSHESIADPTHGRVNYVDQATAQRLNLTYASSNSFIMRADYTTTLPASGPGRNSVRIQSKKQWGTHLEIMDVRHMPQGCGSWPAYWTTDTSNWPAQGEIDIIEGVNDQSPNAATLHTTAGCTQPATRDQTGITTNTDCNWLVNGNSGCGVQAPTADSYGPSFNTNGGGWYAMERTSTYIKVWFWPRNSATVPAAVKSGLSTVDTSSFGTPFASFVNTSCDIASHFGPENIIINLTFCGDWAGNADVYAGSGCPSTCVDYVNNNPAAFKNAYWDIAALRVYQ
ncbi:hypothetical protein FRC09_007865 [Ceratobasidium sp. 395]|nr:hypothetical protein FRC09_007865 [Ceratobasidium sp. 395]